MDKKKKIYAAKKSVAKKGIVLPLYFGYGLKIKIALVKIRRRLFWPFKRYWQQVVATVFLLILTGSGMWIMNYFLVQAATYYWVQDSWTTQSPDTADHTNNRTGWVNYLAKDDNLTAGANLSLAGTDGSWIQTSNSDFNEGTYSADEIEVSNNDIALKLDCGLCGEHIWGSGCQPKAAGDYDLLACQKCDGVSLDPINYTNNIQDTVGPNLCNGTCHACQSGSCGYADNSTDPGDDCSICEIGCNGSGSCLTAVDSNWGEGPSGCSETNQRCYDNICRTCSGSGYFYDDGCSGCAGQGGKACWYYGAAGQSCDAVCGGHTCVAANWNNTDWSVHHHFTSCSSHQINSWSIVPSMNNFVTNFCRGRDSGTNQSCSASSGNYRRMCVCNY